MRNDIDFNALRAEYVAGNIGMQKLAESAGVSYKTLRERAEKEKWTALRAEYRRKTGEKLTEALSEEYLKKINTQANRLLQKLTVAVNQLDRMPVIERESGRNEKGNEFFRQRVTYERSGQIDRAGLRTLTAALKELQTLAKAANEGAAMEIRVTFDGGDGGDGGMEELCR